jgi:hypothetical protein
LEISNVGGLRHPETLSDPRLLTDDQMEHNDNRFLQDLHLTSMVLELDPKAKIVQNLKPFRRVKLAKDASDGLKANPLAWIQKQLVQNGCKL